jgi:hypothetical protein
MEVGGVGWRWLNEDVLDGEEVQRDSSPGVFVVLDSTRLSV